MNFQRWEGTPLPNTYIEYIDKKYGWEKLMEIIKTEDYEMVFGKSDEDIYNEWVDYIKNYYQ